METTVYIHQIGLRVRLTPVTTRLRLCLPYLARNNHHHQPCPHVPRMISSRTSGTNFLATTLLSRRVPQRTLGTPPCSYLISKVLLNTMDLRPGGSRLGSIRHSCSSKNGAYSTSHHCSRIQ
ncbi:hypothetical protein CTA2_2135 [Colletotrichum tanaceti]|nr:hypothetical protein CTA2_2135 [Colletotrichum tanaceti]